MRWPLAACLIAVGISGTRADEFPDPLRFVPKQADVALRVEPGKLVEAIQSIPKLAELAKFPALREGLDSTNVRRFVKLLNYYERSWGFLADVDRAIGRRRHCRRHQV